ncbi:MAG: sigma-54 dependent transcriptional regulator, partial [Elusimicrobiota bacterium]
LAIRKTLETKHLKNENRRLRERLGEALAFDRILGADAGMDEVKRTAGQASASESTILIRGESGTGKDLLAQAIHEHSPRREHPYIAVNCAALPETLLESELFGHVKGSFTGAIRDHEGLFRAAEGGTLFLDEIAEISPAIQVKLLRALQEGEIRRVGDNHPFKVSGRLIAATNKDLSKLVEEGKFREDLFYRLKVFPIDLPPLRDRPEDILPLAEHFLRKARKKLGGKATKFSPEAAKGLRRYRWPGNVRELEHVVERVLIMASGMAINAADLPPEILPAVAAANAKGGPPQTLEESERRHVRQVLEDCDGNQAEAAKRLGVARNTLWRKLRAYGIQPPKK